MSSKKKPRKEFGKWFQYDRKEEIPGTLIIDEEKFSQVLILYTKFDFSGVKIDFNKSSFQEITTIYGEVRAGISITLQNCFHTGSSLIGDGLWEIKFKPEFSFLSGFLLNPEETTYYQIKCSYPYLSSWYDTNRNYFGSYHETSDLDKMKPALAFEDLVDEIKIDNELSIIIERSYSQNAWVVSKEVSASVNLYVYFRSSSPKKIIEFRKLSYRFLQLIQLSVGKLIYLNFISAVANSNDVKEVHYQFQTKEGYPNLLIYNYIKIHKRMLVRDDDIHQNMMLFYGGDNVKEQLNQIIVSWFKSYDTYSSVYNRFLDTFEWFQNTDANLSQVMFYNRFVNLIQALESYHCIRYPQFHSKEQEEEQEKVDNLIGQIPDVKDREWLNKKISLHIPLAKRLEDLIGNRLLFITEEIFMNKGKRKSFIHKVKTARDEISHGNGLDIEPENIEEYYEKALILLLSCILLNIGLNPEQVKKAFFGTYKYSNIIGYIKSRMK